MARLNQLQAARRMLHLVAAELSTPAPRINHALALLEQSSLLLGTVWRMNPDIRTPDNETVGVPYPDSPI